MDRFIVDVKNGFAFADSFKIQYGQIYSMSYFGKKLLQKYLKSNMDRFIDYDEYGKYVSFANLKSNMDRFIVRDRLICQLMFD